MDRSPSVNWAGVVDWIFPRLEGSEAELQKSEAEKAARESQAIEEAVQWLPSDIERLKAYLADAEKAAGERAVT